ncbi:hypothetical protein H4R99_000721 [Coemansia sp. RSA 1722]|nr:hypothetical protein IWW45_000637 [Coemansia sp. RSA 485]KAJ2602493.1 hypothetical protein GGF39_000704 [Coemansia sp. RSA 1721]KAJ2606016.1 hypothetical protein H4R99_000721 [Coemansia sp. RSA 1722]
MAFAAGAAVTLPTIGALGALAYYSKHPDDAKTNDGTHKQQLGSSLTNQSSLKSREFIIDDDPSDFSTFSSMPKPIRRKSTTMTSSSSSFPPTDIKPDHSLLEEPHLQVWRDRYKWGRNYGMNYAHNDK